MAQAKPPIDMTSRRKNVKFVCVTIRMSLQTISDTASGVRQYPSTHTDWKNDLKEKKDPEIASKQTQ